MSLWRVSSRTALLRVAIQLRSVKLPVQVRAASVCDPVVRRLTLVGFDEPVGLEFVERIVNRRASGRVARMDLDVVVYSRASHEHAGLIQDLQDRVTRLVHPLGSFPHSVQYRYVCVLAPPIGRASSTNCPSSICCCCNLYILSKPLSTIDGNDRLPTERGGLGAAESGVGRVDARSTPRKVGTAMRRHGLRGLESPATTVEGGDLARVDAQNPGRNRGVDARVTASNSSRDSPGEGHLRPDRDQ